MKPLESKIFWNSLKKIKQNDEKFNKSYLLRFTDSAGLSNISDSIYERKCNHCTKFKDFITTEECRDDGVEQCVKCKDWQQNSRLL